MNDSWQQFLKYLADVLLVRSLLPNGTCVRVRTYTSHGFTRVPTSVVFME